MFGSSHQKVLLKIGVPKMLAAETAIFTKSYFERTPLTSCYCILLKRLEPESLVFENIANDSAGFIENAQSRTYFKYIFNSNILWNLEFEIFDFTRYKTLVHGARFPPAAWCVRNKTKFIYFDLLPLLFFASFMKHHHHNTFSYNTDWLLHFRRK